MTTVSVILPPGCSQGQVVKRSKSDKSRKINLTVPSDVQIVWIQCSPSGTTGGQVIENGNVWSLNV